MTDAATTTADSAEAPAARRRRRWSLQSRLIVAVTGMVALILVLVAVLTGAILGNILDTNLNARLYSAASTLRVPPDATAEDVLDAGRQPAGFLFVMRTATDLTGAYVTDDATVAALSDTQLDDLVDELARSSGAGDGSSGATVNIDGLGEYRIVVESSPTAILLAGLPTSEVTAVVGQILTTVALVTTGGLLLLGLAIALIIRASLQPLRSVAATAQRVARMPMAEGEVSITERVSDAETDEHTEIGRVGHALNTLLDHVESSLAARQRNEELMRRFVADASHELRTPLASIRGYSELSLRDPALSATTGSALERIQAQSLRMTALVEDLLLLARLDEGQELVFGSVDLTRLAIEAVTDARAAGPDHRWLLEVGEVPVVVAGDTGRLHQVVANLLANARTHTPAGTTVALTLTLEGDEAVLSVHDDGPGIDEAVSEELFERFSRADRSRARKTGGTGLGLSIARAIVQAHGGSIGAESSPGDTTFTVRLPARPADPEPEPEPTVADAAEDRRANQ